MRKDRVVRSYPVLQFRLRSGDAGAEGRAGLYGKTQDRQMRRRLPRQLRFRRGQFGPDPGELGQRRSEIGRLREGHAAKRARRGGRHPVQQAGGGGAHPARQLGQSGLRPGRFDAEPRRPDPGDVGLHRHAEPSPRRHRHPDRAGRGDHPAALRWRRSAIIRRHAGPVGDRQDHRRRLPGRRRRRLGSGDGRLRPAAG